MRVRLPTRLEAEIALGVRCWGCKKPLPKGTYPDVDFCIDCGRKPHADRKLETLSIMRAYAQGELARLVGFG